MDALAAVQSNLLTPAVLFFGLGLLAAVAKSDLKFPEPVYAALTIYLLVKLDPSRAPSTPAVPLAQKLRLLGNIGPIILLFGAVTGVIYTGIATPTEASAVGAFVAAIIYFARGRRSRSDVFELIGRATRTSCMIALILLGAHLFSTFFALTQAAQGLIGWVGSLDVAPWVIILVLVGIYLVLGCFMDQMAILVLTVPIVAPLVSALGFDLVWFGVIMIVVAELGMVTPPVGLNCFVVAKYSKTPVWHVFHGTYPHVVAHLIAIAILLLFPQLTLWLPNQMG